MAGQIIMVPVSMVGIELVQLSSLVAKVIVRSKEKAEHCVRLMEHGPMVLHDVVILN